MNKSLLLSSVIIFGLVLTAGLMAASFHYLIGIQQLSFESQSKYLADKFNTHIEDVKAEVKGLATVFYAMDRIESNSLQISSEYTFTQHPSISKTIYAPMVTDAQRLEFEATQQEEGFISFFIHDFNHGMLKAEKHLSYLPITQVEPFDVDNASLLGLDISGQTSFIHALNYATRTGEDVALVASLGEFKPQLWLFKAIYTGYSGRSDPYFADHSREMINGMVGIAADIKQFIDISNLPDHIAVHLTVQHNPDKKNSLTLFQSDPQQSMHAMALAKESNGSVSSMHASGISFDQVFTFALHQQQVVLHISRHISWFDQIFILFFLSGVLGIAFTSILIISTRALLESERRNAAVLNTAMDAIISMDEHGIVQEFNPAAERIFGYSSTEALGSNLADLIIPEQSREQYKLGFARYLKTGKSTMLGEFLELNCLRRNGDSFPAEINVVEVISGKHRLFTSFLRDISIRKKALADLAQLATVVEQSYNAILITDTDGIIQYVNPAFEKLSGFSAKEAIGQTPNIIKSDQHDKKYFSKMWQVISAHKNWTGSFINKAKDGHIYHVEQTIFPIYVDQQHAGYTSVQMDVTERDQLQEQSEHTQRLESLGVLAGGIAHDFNNLLTAIMGNTGLANKTLSNDHPALKYLGNVQNASESAAALCQQMLAYSGKGQFIIQPLNLSESIVEMMQILKSSIAKRVNLDIQLDHHLAAIEADAGQIKQVIMNLVINASEAIGDHIGRVQVKTLQRHLSQNDIVALLGSDHMQAGNFIILQIIDDGCGMDEATRKKIFDPFFTTKFTGRGLGMSAILGIVRGHQGGLKVSSKIGTGTQFDVYFPASDQLVTPQIQELVSNTDDVISIQSTVLVVDDEAMLREIAESILQEMGIKVLLAEDGVQALQILQRHQTEIDVVMLDMTMPKMGGEECYRQLRTFAPDLDVIICSGFAETEVRMHFVAANHIDFLQKPYRPENLDEKIRTVLSKG